MGGWDWKRVSDNQQRPTQCLTFSTFIWESGSEDTGNCPDSNYLNLRGLTIQRCIQQCPGIYQFAGTDMKSHQSGFSLSSYLS